MELIFCKNLKEARKASDLTQQQVAQMLNMANSSYANWELGRTEPSINDLAKLCIIFDVPADYLIGLQREDGSRLTSQIVLDCEPAKLCKPKTALQKSKYDDENELLSTIKKLNSHSKAKLLGYSRGLLDYQSELANWQKN